MLRKSWNELVYEENRQLVPYKALCSRQMKKAMYFTNKNDWNEFRHKGLQASARGGRSCEPFENDFQDKALAFGIQRSAI